MVEIGQFGATQAQGGAGMPSQSRLTFERHLLKDVDRLIAAHGDLPNGPGKPLSVFTRSGVFLLSAAWELYAEEVLREAAEIILAWADDPSELPLDMQKAVATTIRQRAELDVLGFGGEGWRDYVRAIIAERAAALHTPNAPNIVALYRASIGVNVAPLMGPETVALEAFVRKRGDIAHRGVKAGHVKFSDLEANYEYICHLVAKLDNFLITPIKDMIGKQPWNRRA